MSRHGMISWLVIVLWFLPPVAHAAACSIFTSDVDFGRYDPMETQPADSEGAIFLQCEGTATESTAYNLRLGTGQSGNSQQRTLRSAANSALTYNLYQDANRQQIWGEQGQQVLSGQIEGNGQVIHPVFARLPAQQWVESGIYQDRLEILLDY